VIKSRKNIRMTEKEGIEWVTFLLLL